MLSNPTARFATRRVAIWREAWLPPSETFIRAQSENMTTWVPTSIGNVKHPSNLASEQDRLAFSGPAATLKMRLFRQTRRSQSVQALLEGSSVDLVHAHFATDASLIAPICRRLGLPLVVTCHGVDISSAVSRSGPRGERLRVRVVQALQQARRVIAVSEAVAEKVRCLGIDPSNVSTLYTGTSLDSYSHRVPSQLEFDIVFVGRLVEKKGLNHLLDALEHAAVSSRPLKAAIIGDGPKRAESEDQARLSGVPVRFFGMLKPSEVRAIIRRSRVLAVPSVTALDGDMEGLPTVILEAAALGVPTIGFRHSGIPEAVIDGVTGYLCPEGDSIELANLMCRTARDEGATLRLGEAARRLAEERFDIRRQTAKLEEMYDQVIAL